MVQDAGLNNGRNILEALCLLLLSTGVLYYRVLPVATVTVYDNTESGVLQYSTSTII